MNEKEIFDCIEKVNPEDIKFSKDETLDQETLSRIKAKTFSKLEKNQGSKISTFQPKVKKIGVSFTKIVAAILIIAFVIPVSVTALTGIYKYIPGLGGIVTTEDQLYDMVEVIEIETSLGTASLESFIYVDENYANTAVNIQFSKTQNVVKPEEQQPVMENAALIINGQRYETNLYGSGWSSDYLKFSHQFYNIPNFSTSDEVIYEFSLIDGSTYQFEVKLQSVEGAISLEEVGPTDTKHNLSITAKVLEKDNLLDVNFISLRDGHETITEYCLPDWSEQPCTITLTDALGTTVSAEEVFHNDRNNHFQFNIENLVKPYVIKIESVTVRVDRLSDGAIKQNISLPKVNETKNEVEPLVIDQFKLPIKEVSVTSFENEAFSLSLTADEPVGVTIKFDLPQAFINGKRIKNIQIQDFNPDNPFSFAFKTFQGYGATGNLEGFVEELYIGLKRQPATLNLYIWSYDVEVQGNWEFIVE